MKKIYIFIIFMIFFNIMTFMVSWFGIFPGEGSELGAEYTDESSPGEDYIESLSDGLNAGDAVSIFLGDFNSLEGALASIIIIAGSIGAAILIHSPAPLVLGFAGTIAKNMYLNAFDIFGNYNVNSYFMMAFGAGMVILFIITCAEYLTHGDV